MDFMMNRDNRVVHPLPGEEGFTLVEVIVAGTILITLCVGTIVIFGQAIVLNRGNDIRMQALTVLQRQVEFYRSLKYQPIGPDPLLNGHTQTTVATGIPSADGTLFDVEVTIDNDPYTAGIQTATSGSPVLEVNCKFKEITIVAKQHNPQSGWLQDLKTTVTFRRVRLVN